jgi:hypothetical protein
MSHDGKRILDETGELLQTDGGWQLENHENDNGPVILHVPCRLYICDLNRKYPKCRECGNKIPNSMISSFSMLNWNHVKDEEYFVQPEYEDMDFVYNGHLRKMFKKHPNLAYIDLTEEEIAEVLKDMCDWYSNGAEVTHYCGGTTDEKKNNKPKETQIPLTKWFNPTTLDEETSVLKCKACSEEVDINTITLVDMGG